MQQEEEIQTCKQLQIAICYWQKPGNPQVQIPT